MSFRVVVLPRAESDIERNAKWWADHHSPEQATHWLFSVRDQLQTLQKFPESHSLSQENDEFDYEIRDKLVGLGSRPRYRAIFTIRGDEVFVLTVRAAEEDRLAPDDITFDPGTEPFDEKSDTDG
jgi:plasmid stabilization system protein ParE